MKKQTAIVLTHGMLATANAKTCHGLLRGSDRFEVLAVIDYAYAGQDAGTLLDGQATGVPVIESVAAWFDGQHPQPDVCIVGVALAGGQLPEAFKGQLLEALQKGCDLVNGLHTFLNEIPEFYTLASQLGRKITDVRQLRPRHELQFWQGRIYEVGCPIIAVMGTDCALGKRTTTRWLMAALRQAGHPTEMIYTGQTGWMQGSPYGFIFDSTVNDFIGGELEKAILHCWHDAAPAFILLEGQSALRNPSGPCGSEFLLSGNAKGVVLQHAPGRHHFEGTNVPIGHIKQDIDLVRAYGSEVIAITLNGEELTPEALRAAQATLSQETGLPVFCPLEDGVAGLAQAVLEWQRT